MTRGSGCWIALALAAVLPLAPSSVEAQIVRQVTHHVSGGDRGVGGVDDAGVVYFVSAEDPQGLNPDARYEVMSWDPTSGNVTQITQLHRGVVRMDLAPAVSDDGQWIAFVSTSDPFGINHDQGPELFVIRSDGTQLAQLTQDPGAGIMNLYAISGDGTTIAFTSSADYLGTNPSGECQVFVVGRDGSNLAQVTNSDRQIWWVSISDDAGRIAFFTSADLTGDNPSNHEQVFVMDGDGSNLRQLVTTLLDSNYPHLAGDGSLVAFNSTDDDDAPEVYVANWDGSGLLQLTSSYLGGALRGWARYPTVTDDAQWVYYEQNDLFREDVVRKKADGTMEQDLLTLNGVCTVVRVSGTGNRFALWCVDGENFGQPNPDDGPETITAEGDGSNPEVITDRPTATSVNPDITPDGGRIVFASQANLLGGDPDYSGDIYRLDVDSDNLVQVTSLDPGGPVPNILWPYLPVQGPDLAQVSGDGATIVFSHNGDPTAGNPDLGRELYAIDADGSNLRQLTASSSSDARCDYPQLSANGGVIVFRCNADLTGGGGLSGFRMFRINADASGIVELASVDGFPRIDDAGDWVAFDQTWDPFGTNADGSREVFRIRSDGSNLQQLTDELVNSSSPDVSADGSLAAFVRDGEIFVHDVTGGTDSQLTVGVIDALLPVISGDGSWVYFLVGQSFGNDAYRVRVSDGLVQRVGGLPTGGNSATVRIPLAQTYEADHDGDRLAVGIGGNPTDRNFDRLAEIFLIDRSAPPIIRVSSGPAPTIVSWTVMSGPVSYDVVRGDVANLSLPGGGISNLGPVTCLDDDSPDATTVGSEDPDTPLPGQAFFYLFRPTDFLGFTAGYGNASTGDARTPGAGDCNL